MRCAVIELSTNTVVNIIMADPLTDHPTDGCSLVGLGAEFPCDIGWIYEANASVFINPNPVPDPIPDLVSDTDTISVDEVTV